MKPIDVPDYAKAQQEKECFVTAPQPHNFKVSAMGIPSKSPHSKRQQAPGGNSSTKTKSDNLSVRNHIYNVKKEIKLLKNNKIKYFGMVSIF